MSRRILVTGANGFVGAATVRILAAAGDEVHALVREGSDLSRLPISGPGNIATSNVEHGVSAQGAAEARGRIVLQRADVRDLASLRSVFEAARPSHVLHAAISGVRADSADESELVATNLVGAHNLLLCCREAGVQTVIYTGGSSEYGPKSAPMTERDPPEPVGLYGASKAGATLLFQQAAREHALRAVVLRLFSVYGPGESAHRLIPTTIRAALDGSALPLTAGTWRRDFVFVDDCVSACRRVMDGAGTAGEIYNIGTGIETSNEEIVARIEELTGRKIDVRRGSFDARAGDSPHWVANISKAKRDLGWEPATRLMDGLQAAIDFEFARPGYLRSRAG